MDVSPDSDYRPVNTNEQIYLYPLTATGNSYNGDVRYWVSDANDARISGFVTDQVAATVSGGYGSITVTSSVAEERHYNFYIDDNANGSWDANEPLGVTTVDWNNSST